MTTGQEPLYCSTNEMNGPQWRGSPRPGDSPSALVALQGRKVVPMTSSYTVEFVGRVTGPGRTSWEPMGPGAVLAAIEAWERDGIFQITRVTRDSDGAVMVEVA